MTHLCDHCQDRAVADASVCGPCGRRLAQELRSIAALVPDLDLALAKQTAFGDRGLARPSAGPPPLAYSPAVSEVMWRLRNTLTSWARVVLEEKPAREETSETPLAGPEWPLGAPDTPPQVSQPIPTQKIALWLSWQVEWIRHHPAAAEAFDELHDAARCAHHVIDRPAERTYAGPCDQCGQDLYAKPGAAAVACSACEAKYDLHRRREWLLAAVEDTLATASEISRALTRLDAPITADSITSYAYRGRLTPHTRNRAGKALYRVGDVLDLIAGQKERAS